MSNRRLPRRQPLASPPAEEANPLNGLDSPEAIEALERAAAELLQGSNLTPRELVVGLLGNEADRQAIERGFAVIQHNLERGINTLRVQFSEPRNTAEARLVARALQRLSKARLVFNEDPHDQTRFADRRQSNLVELISAAKKGACRIGQTAAVVSCCVSSLVRRRVRVKPLETKHEPARYLRFWGGGRG